MTTQIHDQDIQQETAEPRVVALVGRYAYRHLLDATTTVADCRVVLVESTTHAYSKIKRALPDMIVMCLSDDDIDGCQVLSMLALDRETSRIPVFTFVAPDPTDLGETQADALDSTVCGLCPMAVS